MKRLATTWERHDFKKRESESFNWLLESIFNRPLVIVIVAPAKKMWERWKKGRIVNLKIKKSANWVSQTSERHVTFVKHEKRNDFRQTQGGKSKGNQPDMQN